MVPGKPGIAQRPEGLTRAWGWRMGSQVLRFEEMDRAVVMTSSLAQGLEQVTILAPSWLRDLSQTL